MFYPVQSKFSPVLAGFCHACPDHTPVPPAEPPSKSYLTNAPDADQDISTLLDLFVTSRAAAHDAEHVRDRLEAEFVEPEVPEALLVRDEDAGWFLPCRVPETTPSGRPFWFHPTDIERLSKTAHQLYDVHDSEGRETPAELRRREIVEAHRMWWPLHQEAQKQSGLLDAITREQQLWHAQRPTALQLARSQPHTLKGVLLKARAVAAIAENEADLAEWLDEEGDGTMCGLAISLTADLIRLAGLMPTGSATA